MYLNCIKVFFYHLLQALKFLHDKGFPYGHLHASNVLVEENTCKLLDIENSLLGLPSYYRPYFTQFRKMNVSFFYTYFLKRYNINKSIIFYCNIICDQIFSYLSDNRKHWRLFIRTLALWNDVRTPARCSTCGSVPTCSVPLRRSVRLSVFL